jgi:VanZ family protein
MWMVLVSTAYGVAMEFIQHYFVVNRSFELGDILADGAGSVLGYFFSYRAFLRR